MPHQSSPPVSTSPMARLAAPLLMVPFLIACSGSADDDSSALAPTTTESSPDPAATADVSDISIPSAVAPISESELAETAAPGAEPVEQPESSQLDEGARLACANAELALFDLLEAAPGGPTERVEAAASWAADSQFEEFQAFSTSLSASASGDGLEASLRNVLTTCEERGYERF